MFRINWRPWHSPRARIAQRFCFRPRLEALEDRAAPATHVWSGSVGNLMSVDANWSSGGHPSNAEGTPIVLMFPKTAAHMSVIDDIDGLNTDQLQFNGSTYAISGTGVTLNLTGVATTRPNIDDQAGGNSFSATGLTLNLAASTVLNVKAGTFAIDSVLTGPGGVQKTGDGTASFSAANTFGGGALVSAGTLIATNVQAIGSGAVTLAGGTLSLAAGSSAGQDFANNVVVTASSTIDVESYAATMGTLTIGTATLTVLGNGPSLSSGPPLTLGPTTLTGSPTFFPGPNFGQTLNLGTIMSNVPTATITLGGAGVVNLTNVPNGVTLAGSGKIGNPIRIESGGTVNPSSTTGVTGALNAFDEVFFASGSTYAVDLGAPTFGSFEQLGVGGRVDLNSDSGTGATLRLALTSDFVFSKGQTYTIIQNYGSNPISGTFSGLPEGAIVTAPNGVDFAISYVGGTGHDVVLTAKNMAFSKFDVTLLGGSPIVAGSSFLFTVQATDALDNPVAKYTGPTNISISANPSDPQGGIPASGSLNNGFGFYLGTLKTARSYTLTAAAGGFSGISAAFTVAPAAASYFAVTAPASASTGSAIDVTVQAFDQYGNAATGYTGQVHFSSTDLAAALPADATLGSGFGIFPVTLKTAGNQTVTATDTVSVAPTITGTSSAITTRGLTVNAFTPTATGFTVTFSKPFDPAKLTMYGVGATAQDATLTGAMSGVSIGGTLIIDPSNTGLTFKASAIPLDFINTVVNNGPDSVVLPDDTYTVKLKSGAAGNGFFDLLGAGLDGSNTGGHADYTTTFTTHYQANKTPVLAIPDFARGPDDNSTVKVPNDTGHGIPVTLYNALGVTGVTFTLNYDSTLLTIAGGLGGGGSDATDPASTLKIVPTPGVFGQVTVTYQDSSAKSGLLVLGDILATVPSTAKTNYKSKELLQPGNIQVSTIFDPPAVPVVPAPGVHVNAYAGDVSGDGLIGAADVNPMFNVAIGAATGFAPYSLLDPVIVGDVANDVSVDGGDVATLKSYILHFPRPVIPTPPGLTGIVSPNAADPKLSLVSNAPLNVSVMVDHPHPEGSTGLTESVLALKYDPSMVSVSAAEITFGSIPSQGTGWQLRAVVDQAAGEIGIELFSDTPILANDVGSLVNIAFHAISGASGPTVVQLVDSVTPQVESFTTMLADAQGGLILSPGIDKFLLNLT